MCGIAGFLMPGAQSPDAPTARATLERMIHALRHRGPDGYGFHVELPVALAHARLSIIDLASGDQPIGNEDDSVQVVFNGEIFNYIELRAGLIARGHRFRTQSDTEVIVHLYEERGDDFVAQLNGQFAIALWDRRRQRLLLTRDRVGIRPLFYTQARGGWWFASEIKSLLAALPERRRLDLRGIAQAFTFWSALDPVTSFEAVHSLPPGCQLAMEADGRSSLRRYWDWQFPAAGAERRLTLDQAAGELRELLIDAVRLQLRADVPVGAYLSGGLDSSGLVSLVRSFSSAPLRTFSITFDDAEFDESAHQQALVRYLQTDHTALHCRRADIGATFPRLIEHTETPLLRTAAAPLMLLSGEVHAAGFKVVLSGEGADEVFGGYDLFKEAKIRRFWAHQPQSRWRPLLLQRLYAYLRHSPVAARAMSQQFFAQGLDRPQRAAFAHLPRWHTTQHAWRFFSPEARAALQDFDPIDAYERQLPDALPGWSGLARDQYTEAHTLLAGYLLSSQGDRVAMANSVEGRVPYLDHRVVEWAAQLPPSFKLRGLEEKHILRRALRGLLPQELLQRPKQPYRAPDSASFFDGGQPLDYVREQLDPARITQVGLFDPAAVTQLYDKCRAGRARGFADNQAFVGVLSVMLLEQGLARSAIAPDL
jgi:asparagine synthase (glutamine-hydrolysing)